MFASTSWNSFPPLLLPFHPLSVWKNKLWGDCLHTNYPAVLWTPNIINCAGRCSCPYPLVELMKKRKKMWFFFSLLEIFFCSAIQTIKSRQLFGKLKKRKKICPLFYQVYLCTSSACLCWRIITLCKQYRCLARFTNANVYTFPPLLPSSPGFLSVLHLLLEWELWKKFLGTLTPESFILERPRWCNLNALGRHTGALQWGPRFPERRQQQRAR